MSLETKDLSRSILKGIMTDAIVDRGYCPDVNAVTIAGMYRCDMSTANKPVSLYGALQYSIADAPNCAVQKFYGAQGQGLKILLRMRWVNTWSDWVTLL